MVVTDSDDEAPTDRDGTAAIATPRQHKQPGSCATKSRMERTTTPHALPGKHVQKRKSRRPGYANKNDVVKPVRVEEGAGEVCEARERGGCAPVFFARE